MVAAIDERRLLVRWAMSISIRCLAVSCALAGMISTSCTASGGLADARASESDGGDGDGGTDGGGGDRATFTLYSVEADGMLRPNAPIAFQGADGRLLAVIRTDKDGVAIGPMEPGGLITFWGDPYSLITVGGVQVGDAIVRWRPSVPVPDPEPAGSVAVTLPGPVDGAATYSIFTSCSGVSDIQDPSSVVTVDLTTCDIHAGSIDVVAFALGTASVHLAGAMRLEVEHGGGTTALTLPGWSSDTIDLSLAVSDLPITASRVHA